MNYHDITDCDMKNGDGLRVVLWLSGCAHNCKGCQNPITHNPDDGLLFDEAAYAELLAKLNKNYISGLTLSGGDPLYEGNLSEVYNLLCRIKKEVSGKSVWIYTGDLWEEIVTDPLKKQIVSLADVVVEGPYVEALRDEKLMWKGSSNQRVIDVFKSLSADSVVLHCENYYDYAMHIYSRTCDNC